MHYATHVNCILFTFYKFVFGLGELLEFLMKIIEIEKLPMEILWYI